MPTKRNRAGKQQNYIEAGHGDASGEYGDNATGSNKHFTQFKKANKEEKPIEDVENVKIEQGIKETTDVKGVDGNKEYIKNNSTYKEERLNKLNEIIDSADKDCISLLNNAYGKSKYRFETGSGVFYQGTNTLKCDKTDVDDGFRTKGSIWFHENGHLLDFSSYKEEQKNEKTRIAGMSLEWTKTEKLPISAWYKNEDGKTLNDICKTEIREIVKSGKVKEIVNKKQEFYNENLLKMNFDEAKYNEFENKLSEIQNRKDKEISAITDDLYGNKIKFDQYRLKKSQIDTKYQSEFASIRNNEEYKKLSDIKYDAKTEADKKMFKLYSCISDLYSSTGVNYGFCGGHTASYYKKDKTNAGCEFFANCFSAKAVNKEQLAEIKKYLPKSYEMFEKILKDGIKNGQ